MILCCIVCRREILEVGLVAAFVLGEDVVVMGRNQMQRLSKFIIGKHILVT
jgi:hypothetical protein